ncbi:hypothetical protein [Deinococcus budaensis]|uniref:F0F1-type ATP synthase membrane subunit b/b'/chaperonin cofactor prefoldin n=1 Tax=Deinococcus budaensis TaxID=1665626 RepID=A0A7W8GF24_9DEIO|nr:hypothetical protein [Deinococcus budaensis]MBB5234164.1 F0F1-type ATP synthase membrane subunit b/b'/chaperonin cofactor prefoldin [Deinococcus budaensis]
MSHKTLFIKRLARYPESGPYDQLHFQRGVNVLVGPPNTGKTQWLRMLDYLWGDPGSPEQAFDEDLAEKYERIEALVEIGGEEFLLERRWKEKGGRTKVYINGEAVGTDEFSSRFLSLLDLPLVHFPSGNPYASRKWPLLSWRELYRHIYRRQDSWSDLAARQPEGTQHACLLYFLGIAEHVYSETYSEVVNLNKQLGAIETTKEQFAKLLQRVSQELIDAENLGLNLTGGSIDAAQAQLKEERDRLTAEREDVLRSAREQVPWDGAAEVDRLSKRWEDVQVARQQLADQQQQAEQRLHELQAYAQSVADELGRMQRAQAAGSVLADLRATHCPVCDRAVNPRDTPAGHCYMCKQPDESPLDEEASRQRVEFEFAQLQAEAEEADGLVRYAEEEVAAHQRQARRLREEFEEVAASLRPIQRATAAIVPPELSRIDNQMGRLHERERQLERLRSVLGLRQELIEETERLQTQRDELERELERRVATVDFEEAANELANGMNFYLKGEVARANPDAWTQERVNVLLRERGFTINVGEKSWRKLGGTMSLFFLVAYNYALLRLSPWAPYRYPGLLILDMPAKFEDTQMTRDEREQFVVEPFVRLRKQAPTHEFQVLVTGRSFFGLQDAHRIELDTIWT